VTLRFSLKVQVARAVILSVLALSMLTENLPALHGSLTSLRQILGALHLRQNWELFIGYPHRRDRGFGWSIESVEQPTQGPQALWPNWPELRQSDIKTRALYYLNAERVRSIHHKNDLSMSFERWTAKDLQNLVQSTEPDFRLPDGEENLRFRLFRVKGQQQVLPQPPWRPNSRSARSSSDADQIRAQLVREWTWLGAAP
jgi:hypothetical protein